MRKTAAVIGIGFLSTVWLTGCVSDEMIIQANWKMQLPDGGKELYHADTGDSFHGDGEKYTVLQYENTEDISEFLNWRSDDGTGTLYTNSYSEFAENCLNIIDVPQKERPDYEECVYSYRERETDSSELLLVYDKEKFFYSVKRSIPILIGYFPVGMAYGILMANAGYQFGWSVIISMFVYTGSLHMLMVSFLVNQIPLMTVAVTALLLNSRHIFYGLFFIEKFREYGIWKYFLIYGLTDENYSLLCSYKETDGVNEKWVHIFSTILLWVY